MVIDFSGQRHCEAPIFQIAGKLHNASSFVFDKNSIDTYRSVLQSDFVAIKENRQFNCR
jgi:hypothetical protein